MFGFFKRSSAGSAPVARERLQVLLAHERVERLHHDLIGKLRDEIMAVIAKHVKLDPAKVRVKMDRSSMASTLAIDIELPSSLAGAQGLAA